MAPITGAMFLRNITTLSNTFLTFYDIHSIDINIVLWITVERIIVSGANIAHDSSVLKKNKKKCTRTDCSSMYNSFFFFLHF